MVHIPMVEVEESFVLMRLWMKIVTCG